MTRLGGLCREQFQVGQCGALAARRPGAIRSVAFAESTRPSDSQGSQGYTDASVLSAATAERVVRVGAHAAALARMS